MKALSKSLFWFHLGLIFLTMCAGYFLTPGYSIMIILFHEAYVAVFHGCPLTHFAKHLNEMPKKDDIFQYAIKRLFGIRVNKVQARIVNYGIIFFALFLSFFRFGIRF